MVRDPWTLAVALFAFGVIAWVVVAPKKSRFGSRHPGPWLPTLTFDWFQSAAHTCGRNGDERTGAQPLTLLLVVLAPPATKIPNHGRPVCR